MLATKVLEFVAELDCPACDEEFVHSVERRRWGVWISCGFGFEGIQVSQPGANTSRWAMDVVGFDPRNTVMAELKEGVTLPDKLTVCKNLVNSRRKRFNPEIRCC